MGMYYTCNICGATEKGTHPDCNCVENEEKRILEMRNGTKIVESTLIINNDMKYVMEKLEKEGSFIYIVIVIDTCWDSYSPRIYEIEKDQYDNDLPRK
jgi:hypothetical protein